MSIGYTGRLLFTTPPKHFTTSSMLPLLLTQTLKTNPSSSNRIKSAVLKEIAGNYLQHFPPWLRSTSQSDAPHRFPIRTDSPTIRSAAPLPPEPKTRCCTIPSIGVSFHLYLVDSRGNQRKKEFGFVNEFGFGAFELISKRLPVGGFERTHVRRLDGFLHLR